MTQIVLEQTKSSKLLKYIFLPGFVWKNRSSNLKLLIFCTEPLIPFNDIAKKILIS